MLMDEDRRLEKPNNRARVLCVDDIESSLVLCATILTQNGLEVTSCSGVDEASDGANFDLAVLDYEMLKMNGCELAARLKKASPELKIILYTGSVNLKKHELCFVDQVVCKGDGISTLLEAIDLLLPARFSQNSLPRVRGQRGLGNRNQLKSALNHGRQNSD